MCCRLIGALLLINAYSRHCIHIHDAVCCRLIGALLRSARHNYYVLKGHSLATADMTSEFRRLQQLLRCPARVAWTDRCPPPQLPTTSQSSVSCHPHQSTDDAAAAGLGRAEHIDFERLLQFPADSCRLAGEDDKSGTDLQNILR